MENFICHYFSNLKSMNVLKKYAKHNGNHELKKLKYGTTYKNYYPKNKYIFNEIYKEQLIPREELVFLVKRILNHKSKFETSQPDLMLKKIAEGFVKEHHDLFEDFERKDENTDDEYEENLPKIISLKKEEDMNTNVSKNDVENVSKNDVENVSKNDVENVSKNTIEKLDEIKQDVKDIEQLKEHPDKKHIEEFNARIAELKDDISRKFNDMIDSHMDLKKSIEEKRNINDKDAKARIDNMEGKIEMLYGQQMEEKLKPKKEKKYQPAVKSKEDIMREFISKKFIT